MEKVTAIVDPHPESDQHQNLTILYGYLCSILQTLVDIPLRLPEVLANRQTQDSSRTSVFDRRAFVVLRSTIQLTGDHLCR